MRAVFAIAVFAIAVAATGCAGKSATQVPTPGPLVTYRASSDGIAFDYPSDWRVIAKDLQAGESIQYVDVVLGTGSWSRQCGNGGCQPDKFDVASGKIVVKIYRDHQLGPVVMCGSPEANATFGSLAVSQTGTATDRVWEIRELGAPYFGAQNDLWIEARTDDPAQMARAEALVASVKMPDLGLTGPDCWSPDPSAQP